MAAVLPSREYYRASTLGEGTYGSVACVYDIDGNEYAAKVKPSDEAIGLPLRAHGDPIRIQNMISSLMATLVQIFDEDEDDESSRGLDVGTIREISMLRTLNGSHPSIMRLIDVSTLDGSLCMIMPKLAGDLDHAIKDKTLSNKQKLRVAALSLNAMCYLHENGIMHRDLKPENVMLDTNFDPIVADFSLAKMLREVEGEQKPHQKKHDKRNGKKRLRDEECLVERLHTAGAGTPTYIAPEIVNGDDSYGLKADVWSMGVVFYEMFTGSELPVYKDKHALAMIEEAKSRMSDKPIPSLIKQMLEVDPQKRLSAHEALAMIPGVETMELPKPTGKMLLHTQTKPADDVNISKKEKRNKPSKMEISPERICKLLEASNPETSRLASHYFLTSASAKESGPAGMVACALLAYKMMEVDTVSPEDILELELEALDDFDPEYYPNAERQIMQDLNYMLQLPITTNVLVEQN
ncbi:hypothetical protein AB1Y20_005263 [Prymnesium parvum]|uniref:Protein kinase domain-containing protein n=1 Tax=Prymnesium parvum TaxID=97485 RepID=A0AB34J5R6_PRYPA